MKHLGTIAGRELRSMFVSPMAYVVLTLFSVLAGFLFFVSVLGFDAQIVQVQQLQAYEYLAKINLNDDLLAPFYQVIWVVMLFLIPAVTMGLFANEKAQGTQELLFTSPITVWELVIGKFLAAAIFVLLLVALLALFPLILLIYGDPELGKIGAGLLGMVLIGFVYAAIGAFASSLTQNQLIAFFLAFFLLLVLLMLGFLAELGAAGGAVSGEGVSGVLRWLSTAEHFESMLMGLIDTKDLVYFGAMSAAFLVLTKAAVESVRWR